MVVNDGVKECGGWEEEEGREGVGTERMGGECRDWVGEEIRAW